MEAIKTEIETYKKTANAVAKEQMIYPRMSNITSELVTVKDVEKSLKEINKELEN